MVLTEVMPLPLQIDQAKILSSRPDGWHAGTHTQTVDRGKAQSNDEKANL